MGTIAKLPTRRGIDSTMSTIASVHVLPVSEPWWAQTRDVPLPFPEMLPDTLDAWRLRGMAAGHSERTIDARRQTVERLARTVDPMTADGAALVEWLAALPVGRGAKGTYRSHLRSFYGWLVESERREDNPAAKLPTLRVPKGIPHPLTPDEVQRVLAACADSRAAQTRAYVILGAFAGLRVHEIAKVRGEDFRGTELDVTGKGGGTMTVSIVPIMQRLADEMPARGYWFPSDAASGHVHRCSVSAAIQRAFGRAGVTAVPHSLRHYFCTQYLRASGGDLRETQRAARHASPATTAIYTQVLDEKMLRTATNIPGAA